MVFCVGLMCWCSALVLYAGVMRRVSVFVCYVGFMCCVFCVGSVLG